MGTLVNYFNTSYGHNFFVFLNTCFYAPGLPISIIQNKADETFDKYYGHKRTFLVRMAVSLVTIAIICFAFPRINTKNATLGLAAALGTVTWTAHGAFMPMVSLFPKKAVGFAQFGFQLPNIYALLITIALGFNSDACLRSCMTCYTTEKLQTFYWATGAIVCVGLVCSMFFSSLKITTMLQHRYSFNLTGGGGTPGLSSGGIGEPVNSLDQDFQEYFTLADKLERQSTDTDEDYAVDKEDSDEQLLAAPLISSEDVERRRENKPKKSKSESFRRRIQAFTRLHRTVLFFTIFSSIFTGSFFSHVPRAHPSIAAGDMSQLLYFARIFSDLGGRVLTFLPRPACFKTIQGLFWLMVLRVLLLVVFFLYIEPFEVLPKNDTAITVLVAFCGAQSGYTAVLVYEYIAVDTQGAFGNLNGGKGGQAKACAVRMLNLTFQIACFSACVANIAVVYLGSDEPKTE
jgi:hypothetical protein